MTMRHVVAIGTLTLVAGPAAAQPYRGSPDLEPGLAGRDDIVLFEDFELPGWESHWTSVSYTDNHDAVAEAAFQGARGLVFRVPAGQHYGGALDFGFAAAGLAEPEEIYFRYYVRFDPSWELAARDGEIGKLPGFGGTYGVAGWGGRRSDGSNGWSARMMNWDTGTGNAVGFYTYHADMGTWGTHMRWAPDLERERWYCIEAYARMNTIAGGTGNRDGGLRGWIDGAPAFERTDLRFRDVDRLRIEKIWFNIYVGGSWTADHDMQIHFDNVVVARNRIGCWTPGGADGDADADVAADADGDADVAPGADADADVGDDAPAAD
ncbi:MAG: hypothetical protein QME96_07845, partial [Myxococcota bacterium]|nr:hypothetical protein [Myxococcota bacterium]